MAKLGIRLRAVSNTACASRYALNVMRIYLNTVNQQRSSAERIVPFEIFDWRTTGRGHRNVSLSEDFSERSFAMTHERHFVFRLSGMNCRVKPVRAGERRDSLI
jgi:hypothetical protein